MRKFLLFFTILLLINFTGTFCFAQEFKTYKFDNGHTVVLSEVKNNPIVIIDTWVKTGSINETDKNNGVAHFLEHLFFKGTTKHPTGDFDRILEGKGAITNAATSKDFTHYYIEIPSEYFNLALELHSDMLLNPQIPRKELEKERKVVIEEISKDENSPSETVYENLNNMLYTTHPYKRKVIGTKKVIEGITREEILDFYNRYYNPSNMVTVIVGDINSDEVIAKVKENFKTDEKKSAALPKYAKEKQLSTQKRKVINMKTESGYMMIGFRGASINNNDTYPLDILATILGDGKTSILYKSIKDQKHLAYSISAGNSSLRDDGILYIRANFEPSNAEKLERAIFEEIDKIKTNGITEEDLDLAKKIIERDTYYARESISNMASEIGYTVTLTSNPDYYKNYLDKINKVTVKDVKRVANKYLDVNKSAVSICLPEEKEQKAVTDKKDYAVKLVDEDGTLQKYQLDNGATLIINNNNTNDIVAIDVIAKGGKFLEKIYGTSNIMADTMLLGTKKYTSIELSKILESNGIKIIPGSAPDIFTVSVLTTKNQVPQTLELLSEVLNNAKFDDHEIEKKKTEKLNLIKQSRDVPLNVALEEYQYLIYKNSVYSKSQKIFEKTLPKIQRNDIVEYYNKIFNPKNIVISVNGNVDKKLLINEFNEMLGIKDTKKFNYSDYKVSELTEKNTSVKHIKDLKTAWILLGWRTCGLTNTKDDVVLQIIDTILGSGMSSRLFQNIRDQEGLAYQIGSGYSANVLSGAFTVYIGTNPINTEKAKNKMLAEVFRLKNEFVTEKELQSAKEKLLGEYVISLETNSKKAGTIGSFEALGRGFKFDKQYKELIKSVTPSDIIEVANKYFNDIYVMSVVDLGGN
ncbi:insulinase family protein [bacterium]|nr:insulinase family protein [bacterium]